MTNQSTPRVAVVGAGYWGINHVRNFYELGALGLVCDTYAPTTARIREKFPAVCVSFDLADALPDVSLDHEPLRHVECVGGRTRADEHHRLDAGRVGRLHLERAAVGERTGTHGTNGGPNGTASTSNSLPSPGPPMRVKRASGPI